MATLAAFDYTTLAIEARIIVQQKTTEIRERMRRAALEIVEIGERLIAVRAHLPGQQFSAWLACEFAWSRAAAYRYISVAERFAGVGLSQIETFAASALYALAAPATPDEARAEALERAESGERITHQVAQTIIAQINGRERAALIARADAAGLLAENCGDDGLLLRWPDEDPDGIYPLAWEDVDGWLDTYAAVGPPMPQPAAYDEDPAVDQAREQQDVEQQADEKEPPLMLIQDAPMPAAPAAEPPRSPQPVYHSSESVEWYTPRALVERVATFFGGRITTDPCSNSHAAPNVPADVLYTRDDDGLTQAWYGSVYMNPPYGAAIGQWIERLVDAYGDGEITQAIALVPARVDTAWFQPLYAHPICLVRGRLQFENAEHPAPFPSALVYLGPNEEGFLRAFASLGPIVRRIDEEVMV